MINATPMRICRDCGESLPLSEFYPNPGGVNGRHSYCKQCHRRRASESVRRKRAEQRADLNGLSYSEDRELRRSERFVERHEAKRRIEQQALNCIEEQQPLDEGVLGFHEPEKSNSDSDLFPFGMTSYQKLFLRTGNLVR